MTVVLELGAVATAALRAVRDAIANKPHRALTVGEPERAVWRVAQDDMSPTSREQEAAGAIMESSR
jgi:hypothetical protein